MANEKDAKAFLKFLESIVEMVDGEETVDKLHRLAEIDHKLLKCLHDSDPLPMGLVGEHNDLIKQLYQEK